VIARRASATAAIVAVLVAVASCGGRQSGSAPPPPSLELRTHASGAELLVPRGWALAIDGHRASAVSPDGVERMSITLSALPPDRTLRLDGEPWRCEEGTLETNGPYYGRCTQEVGDVAITLSTTSRRPAMPRLVQIAESVHGFTYQPPSEDLFQDADCAAALERMRHCVSKATMLEVDRERLLDRLHDSAVSCADLTRGQREAVRDLGCPPPPQPPAPPAE
jgi:hypothetical protein